VLDDRHSGRDVQESNATTGMLAAMPATPAEMTATPAEVTAAEVTATKMAPAEMVGVEVVDMVEMVEAVGMVEVISVEEAIVIVWIGAINIWPRVIIGPTVCSAGRQAETDTDQKQARYYWMFATNHRNLLQLLSSCSFITEREMGGGRPD